MRKENDMNKMTKALVMVLGFGLLVVAVGVLTSKPVPAETKDPKASVPVTVKNTIAEPVPTSAQGTTTIVGNVNASITNAVSLAPGTVTNTPTTPLFTRDVDNPVRQPVYGACGFPNPQVPTPTIGFLICNISFISPTSSFSSVPAGQRLVIEFVSGEADVPTGTKPLEFQIKTGLGIAYTYVRFVPSSFLGQQALMGFNWTSTRSASRHGYTKTQT
jgi:hypothetical protein